MLTWQLARKYKASKKYSSAGNEPLDEFSNFFREELETQLVPGICWVRHAINNVMVRAYALLPSIWVLFFGIGCDNDFNHLGIRRISIFPKRVDHCYLQSPENWWEMDGCIISCDLAVFITISISRRWEGGIRWVQSFSKKNWKQYSLLGSIESSTSKIMWCFKLILLPVNWACSLAVEAMMMSSHLRKRWISIFPRE